MLVSRNDSEVKQRQLNVRRIHRLTYFTLYELICHRRRVDRQWDISPSPICLRLSLVLLSLCTISVHHLPSDFVSFPSVVVLLAGSRVLCSGEPLVPSFWRVTTTWSCSCLLFALLVALFTRRLLSLFLILSIVFFLAAFLRHLISVVVNICLSLLVRVQFSLW